jgi:CheY-like chemotaxis protein
MPARVVVVHDEPEFVDELLAALNLAGHGVVAFTDPLAAWDALEAVQQTEVLITRVQFALGKSNGLALARMARHKRPRIRIIFVARPEFAKECEEDGVFLPLPTVPLIVKTVELLLQRNIDAKGVGVSLDVREDDNGKPIEPPLG